MNEEIDFDTAKKNFEKAIYPPLITPVYYLTQSVRTRSRNRPKYGRNGIMLLIIAIMLCF